jgi:stage II sporulation protein D
MLLSLMVLVGFVWSGIAPATTPSLSASSAGASAPTGVRGTLRVGMWTLWHDREVVLMPAAPDHAFLVRGCAGCAAREFTLRATVRAEGDSLTLRVGTQTEHAERFILAGPVTLKAHGETVTLRNPVIITAREGVLVVVVTLPFESYVERVVASESGPADNEASLRALAIVVRSFALHETHGHADYDLCDSTHCQLLHWAGNSERGPAAHNAALATAGETMWFHGQRALAYFGKDCGGHTASPDEVWPRAKPVPYLPSRPDNFCTADGGREWSSEITRAELAAALASHGLAAPGWQNLAVVRRGESGRAVTVKLDAREISAEEFRLAVGESLGWNRLPSTRFEISRQGDRFEFHGRGWGNGVGLCQKGAAVMAEQGRSAQEILEQYFPGTRIADEATGREWKTFSGDGFILESLDAGDAAYLVELNRARAEASRRSELHAASPFTVRAFLSTPDFRDATLAPGWVGAFTEGDWIGTQPLRTLAARKLLDATMRHEFLHALVEQQAGPRAPLWLREGLAETWSAEPDRRNVEIKPALSLDATDAALAHATTEAASTRAHRAAEWYAAQLLAHYGHDKVIDWLRSGLPAGVIATLGQR